MYKIFVDDKLICISNQRAYEAFCREFREVNAAGGLVCRPLSQEEIGSQHPDGKVCSTNDGARYLFIRRNGLWDLPKGHQEPGEDIRTTALREVSEETGIPLEQLRIKHTACEHKGVEGARVESIFESPFSGLEKLFPKRECLLAGVNEPGLICITDHCYKRDGIWHLKHTWWYAMELTPGASDKMGTSSHTQTASPSTLIPQIEEGITTATWVAPQDIPALLPYAYSSIPEVFRHAAQ